MFKKYSFYAIRFNVVINTSEISFQIILPFCKCKATRFFRNLNMTVGKACCFWYTIYVIELVES